MNNNFIWTIIFVQFDCLSYYLNYSPVESVCLCVCNDFMALFLPHFELLTFAGSRTELSSSVACRLASGVWLEAHQSENQKCRTLFGNFLGTYCLLCLACKLPDNDDGMTEFSPDEWGQKKLPRVLVAPPRDQSWLTSHKRAITWNVCF